jgi:hypothetical protein
MVAFRSALIGAIRTRAASPGLSIGYGEKPDGTKRSIRMNEAVNTDDPGVTPAGFRGGRTRMDEQYVVTVVCESIGKPTPEESETDAAAMAANVEDAMWDVVETADARPAGVNDATVSGRSVRTDEADGTRSVYLISITVKARTL